MTQEPRTGFTERFHLPYFVLAIYLILFPYFLFCVMPMFRQGDVKRELVWAAEVSFNSCPFWMLPISCVPPYLVLELGPFHEALLVSLYPVG